MTNTRISYPLFLAAILTSLVMLMHTGWWLYGGEWYVVSHIYIALTPVPLPFQILAPVGDCFSIVFCVLVPAWASQSKFCEDLSDGPVPLALALGFVVGVLALIVSLSVTAGLLTMIVISLFVWLVFYAALIFVGLCIVGDSTLRDLHLRLCAD